MSKHYTRAEKQAIWEKWVRKPIFTDSGVYNIAPRHMVMRHFIERGVIPLVRAKGFSLQYDGKKLTVKYLQYLFALYLGDKVLFKRAASPKEYFDEFEYHLDTGMMIDFWNKWGCIEDFEEGGYANEARYTLTAFLWSVLDFESSPKFIWLNKILNELDEMEREKERKEQKGKEDPYLRESSRYTYEDKHW